MDKDQYHIQTLRTLYLYRILLPWNLFSQKKRIEESFTIVIKVNNYVKWFLRYQQFSVW